MVADGLGVADQEPAPVAEPDPTPQAKEPDSDQAPGHDDPAEHEFMQWWLPYGKRVGKAPTRKKWDKLTAEERAKCISVVCRYVAYTPEVQFRKNPLTYLNQRCWEDELPKMPRPNPHPPGSDDWIVHDLWEKGHRLS